MGRPAMERNRFPCIAAASSARGPVRPGRRNSPEDQRKGRLMLKARLAALTVTLAIAATGLTACSQDRWCEHDATDQKVADSYCEKGIPGYEWEPDSDGSKSKKSKSKSSSKSSKSGK